MSGLAIRTTSVIRRFGDILAVDDLNLVVPQGIVYGFLGRNGSGKTTAIRLLLGLLQPDQGTIELFGRPLPDHRRELLRRVGALVESPSLYDHLSGRDNVEITRCLLGLKPSHTDRVLELVGLTDAAGRRVKGYSLGMRQRLGLALALLPEPDLLILDEPINGLDPEGIRHVRDLLIELSRHRGVTVFLSSHLLAELSQLADHVGILEGGRLCAQGPFEELRKSSRSRVEVGLDRPVEAEPLLREAGFGVESVGSDRGYVDITGAGLDRLEALGELNTWLVERGFRVHHLRQKLPTLESVFLELTEGRLGTQGQGVPAAEGAPRASLLRSPQVAGAEGRR
ncbi:MAG: ABC transporter ATP-binding protein [Acidobacteriota bacterium]